MCGMDATLSRKEKSERMWGVGARETNPGMLFRGLVRRWGFLYRLHDRRLPGALDLVLKSRRKAIFIHGCFWHRHPDPACKLARLPKSRLEFWLPKLESNRERDKMNEEKLKSSGWKILVVWECETGNIQEVQQKIRNCLD